MLSFKISSRSEPRCGHRAQGVPITVPSHSDWSRKAHAAQGLPQGASSEAKTQSHLPRVAGAVRLWCGNGQVREPGGFEFRAKPPGLSSPDLCMSYRPLWGSLMHEARSTLLEVWLWELEFHPLLVVNSLCISTHQNEKRNRQVHTYGKTRHRCCPQRT